jgi:germination protein M
VKAAIKLLLVATLITCTSLFMTGCGEKQSAKNDELKSSASQTSKQGESASAPAVNPIKDKKVEIITTTTLPAKMVNVEIYFGNDQADKLVAETRQIEAGSNRLKSAIEELIKGPESSDLVETIPEGTKLLNVDVVNSIAYVNFSGDLSTKHWGGSAMENLTIQSIVYTLTQFDDIKKVKILLDGSSAETIAGHLDITQPLTRDKSILE